MATQTPLQVGVDAYCVVSDADQYFVDRDPTLWNTYTIEQKTGAIRIATRWIDQYHYWQGYLVDLTQPLGWPRLLAYDEDARVILGIPRKLVEAVCELALSHLRDGNLNKVFYNASPQVMRVSAGGGVSVDFDPSRREAYSGYAYVQSLLRGLCYGGPNNAPVVRS